MQPNGEQARGRTFGARGRRERAGVARGAERVSHPVRGRRCVGRGVSAVAARRRSSWSIDAASAGASARHRTQDALRDVRVQPP